MQGQGGAAVEGVDAVLNRIAAETYAAADRLAWEIMEHDAGAVG
jgi:hypothetical protein